MARLLTLDVADWAAIVSEESVEAFGAARDATVQRDNQSRRLPAFARDLIRCTRPLVEAAPRAPLILGAAHGDMHSTVKLLTDIANKELLSPALFALSVHNAAPGALSLTIPTPGDQTAIAANSATLDAALLEAYVRLADGDAPTVVVTYAEAKLPAVYAEEDEAAPGIFLSMALRLGGDGSAPSIETTPGRAGALQVLRALDTGVRRVQFHPPSFDAMAA